MCDPLPPLPTCDPGALAACQPREGNNGATLLKGTVITPDEVLCSGEVLFDRTGQRILCVGESCARLGAHYGSELKPLMVGTAYHLFHEEAGATMATVSANRRACLP